MASSPRLSSRYASGAVPPKYQRLTSSAACSSWLMVLLLGGPTDFAGPWNGIVGRGSHAGNQATDRAPVGERLQRRVGRDGPDGETLRNRSTDSFGKVPPVAIGSLITALKVVPWGDVI